MLSSPVGVINIWPSVQEKRMSNRTMIYTMLTYVTCRLNKVKSTFGIFPFLHVTYLHLTSNIL